MRNLTGLLVSYAYVFGLMGLATLLMRRRVLPAQSARKLIHIGAAHWWLIAMLTMDSPLIASIGPASFIIINALTIRLRLLPAMDAAAGKGNLGTVWFPVSLLVLVNLCWRGVMPTWVGGIGVLIMGWGDGLASVVGERAGRGEIRIWGGRKSIAGTAVMFGASLAVTLAFRLAAGGPAARHFPPSLGAAACTAALATAVEVLTPLGIDNLTVPLAASLFYFGVFT
jgi:phytol kinase